MVSVGVWVKVVDWDSTRSISGMTAALDNSTGQLTADNVEWIRVRCLLTLAWEWASRLLDV